MRIELLPTAPQRGPMKRRAFHDGEGPLRHGADLVPVRKGVN